MTAPANGDREPDRSEAQHQTQQEVKDADAASQQRGARRSSASQPTIMRYATMGFELAAAIGGMTALGWWIDRSFETQPAWLITFASLGVVGGFYNFIREALALNRETYGNAARGRRTGPRDDETP